MKKRFRLIALLILLSLLLPLLPQNARAEEDEEEIPRELRPGRVLVGLGDSFASGESLGEYGDSTTMEEKCGDENWLAHRSNYSWAGMLRLPGCYGTMQDNRDENFFFAAASGAVTANVNQTGRASEQAKKFNRGPYSGTYNLPGQLDVFYNNPKLDRKEVDYVTMSIGGNDVGFEKIIQTAGLPGNYQATKAKIDKELADFYKPGGTADKLRDTYLRVAEAAPNATIIITGYPPLIAAGGGDSNLFDAEEATAIGIGVGKFNQNIAGLINDLKKSGVKIEFVDVQKAFRGHEAYSEDPWINGVQVLPDEEELDSLSLGSMNSIHPNRKGAEAYARLVQQRIDELEEAKRLKREGADISKKRNIVLVLDNSGSMEGDPIQETKSAASSFIDTILKEDASVGVVSFSSGASVRASFSRDAGTLKSAVDGIYPEGMTNTGAGLSAAAGMLRACDQGQKIIILMSDGLTNEGLQGEALQNYIENLKAEGINIYTMGFFQSLYGNDLSEGQQFMEDSSSEGYHYEVEDAEDLVDFFNDMADQINGEEYAYARIACPVDVEVTYKGETLSSADNITRTSFGTLTFEAGEEDGDGDNDNRTKILRLKENGAKYTIEIRGNGRGTMNYTAGYVDKNGEYSDFREIRDVPITKRTYIEANADRNKATTLRVDEDGDGKFDTVFKAGKPSRRWWILIVAGAVLAAAGLVVLIVTSGRRPAAAEPMPLGSAQPAAPRQPVQTAVAQQPAAPVMRSAAPQAPVRTAARPLVPQAPVAQQAPAGAPVCGNCGALNAANSRFCIVCGAKLLPASRSADTAVFNYCMSCGTKNDGNSRFCTSCGAPMLPANRPADTAGFKYCMNCGSRNDGNCRFCTSCGARI